MQSSQQPTWHLWKGFVPCAEHGRAELAEHWCFQKANAESGVCWGCLCTFHTHWNASTICCRCCKQSLGSRFSVTNAFHRENKVRSGGQEQLLSAIQTITSFTPPGFPGACETDAAMFCGRDRMWQIPAFLQSLQCLSFQRCLLEESTKLMNYP